MERTESSVAEALRQAHLALLADLRELELAEPPSSGDGLAELRAQLGEVHAHITEHFRFEEQNGYMDALRKREPRFERAIEQLAEEHRQLRQSLESLIRQSTAAASLDQTLREQIRQWIKRVRQHEVRENDLVQDVFDLDIGTND
jgi:hemerythrin